MDKLINVNVSLEVLRTSNMKSDTLSHPLRIAQIAPLWASVPPATYGGIELRLHWLTEELVARGHEVTLFASGDSQTSAKLRAGCDYNLMDAMANGAVYRSRLFGSPTRTIAEPGVLCRARAGSLAM